MKILIACERSGRVREAFRKKGHDVRSCDIEDADDNSQLHYKCDLRYLIEHKYRPFDLMIAFPPCTDLAVSGARWFKEKIADGRQQKSIDFFMMIANSEIEKISIENPIGIISTNYRKPDQIIQPWQFGHGETKATCLWLKGLPKLKPTNIVEGREQRIWKMGPSPERARLRGVTYQGIADAMADQWG